MVTPTKEQPSKDILSIWNTRAAVAGPRVALNELFDLFEKDKRGRWCFKSLSRDDRKLDSIMDRLAAAATSSPGPAESERKQKL